MPNTPINNLIVQNAGVAQTGLLMGNGTSPVSAAIAANVSAALDLLGATQGNVLYRSGTAWTVLAPGTAGQFLRTAGAGANPTWAAAGGTGDVVGPASSVDNRLATYSGTTGKIIKDASGITALNGVFTSNTLLTLTAGGSNQNITMLPSGTGYVQITAGSPVAVFTQSGPKLLLVGDSSSTYLTSATASGTPTQRNVLQAFKSRGTLASPTTIVSGDYVGSLNFGAYDGSLMQTAATIDIISEGTITAGQTPLKIVMATGLSAAGKADRLTLNSAGLLRLHSYGLGALQSDASGNVTATQDIRTTASPTFAGINIGSSAPLATLGSFNDGASAAALSVTMPNTWSDQRIRLSNSSAFNVSNLTGFDMALNTSTQARTAFLLRAAFTDVTDATRTSYSSLLVATSGSIAEALRLTGAGIQTASPTGSTARPFKVGDVATAVTPTPNRLIKFELNGTVYELLAKTP